MITSNIFCEILYLCFRTNLLCVLVSVSFIHCRLLVTSVTLCGRFDYRPFVVNWCIEVRVLDGYEVTDKEG